MPSDPASSFHSQFHDALRSGILPAGMIVEDGADTQRRFDVYRNNVVVGLTGALAARFPAVQRLLGQEYFLALAKLYAQADPPKTPIISQWGAGFAGFLADFAPLAAYPYLGDVARIEFARGLAYHAADIPPMDPARLMEGEPEALILTLHPSVQVLHLSWPAVAIWQRNQPAFAEANPGPIPAGAQIALILRDPAFEVPVQAISPAQAAMITAIMRGEPLGQAAQQAGGLDPAFDPQPLLVHLMRSGALCQPKE